MKNTEHLAIAIVCGLLALVALAFWAGTCVADAAPSGLKDPLPTVRLPAEYRHAYRSVSACARIFSVFPPRLHVSRSRPCGGDVCIRDLAEDFGGFYFAARPRATVVVPNSDSRCLEHEFVHHLLAKTTGDLDAAHGSPLFAACGDPRGDCPSCASPGTAVHDAETRRRG